MSAPQLGPLLPVHRAVEGEVGAVLVAVSAGACRGGGFAYVAPPQSCPDIRTSTFQTAIAILLLLGSINILLRELPGTRGSYGTIQLRIPNPNGQGTSSRSVDVYAYTALNDEYGSDTTIDKVRLIDPAQQVMGDLQARLTTEA